MNVGDKFYTNDSIGEVIVLDIKKNYLILLREGGRFIKANNSVVQDGKLSWSSGEYYDSLDELMEALG